MVIWGNVVELVIGFLFAVIVTASSAASATRPKFAVVAPFMYVIGVGDLVFGIWALILALWYRRALNTTDPTRTLHLGRYSSSSSPDTVTNVANSQRRR